MHFMTVRLGPPQTVRVIRASSPQNGRHDLFPLGVTQRLDLGAREFRTSRQSKAEWPKRPQSAIQG